MPQILVCNKIAKYFPLSNGEYEVKPGLFPLHHDFGNSKLDSQLFQLDQQFSKFRQNKLDAVIMQIQEDIAVITEDDYISYLHFMAPNFWSAEDKVGQSFGTINKEVAGIEKITKNAKTIINAMIHKGPFVRFAWGVSADDKLNHHPQTNAFMNESGRRFDVNNPNLFLRVERQTINGMPEIKSALFTIRTYLYNIEELSKKEIHSIISAITSMTEEQLVYKGLNTQKQAIINWLTSIL